MSKKMFGTIELNRRSVLSLGALSGLALVSGSCAPGSPGPHHLDFTNRLRIPPLAPDQRTSDGVRRFALELRADGRSEFLPGLTTKTWGINGSYLGPTVRAAR